MLVVIVHSGSDRHTITKIDKHQLSLCNSSWDDAVTPLQREGNRLGNSLNMWSDIGHDMPWGKDKSFWALDLYGSPSNFLRVLLPMPHSAKPPLSPFMLRIPSLQLCSLSYILYLPDCFRSFYQLIHSTLPLYHWVILLTWILPLLSFWLTSSYSVHYRHDASESWWSLSNRVPYTLCVR